MQIGLYQSNFTYHTKFKNPLQTPKESNTSPYIVVSPSKIAFPGAEKRASESRKKLGRTNDKGKLQLLCTVATAQHCLSYTQTQTQSHATPHTGKSKGITLCLSIFLHVIHFPFTHNLTLTLTWGQSLTVTPHPLHYPFKLVSTAAFTRQMSEKQHKLVLLLV